MQRLALIAIVACLLGVISADEYDVKKFPCSWQVDTNIGSGGGYWYQCWGVPTGVVVLEYNITSLNRDSFSVIALNNTEYMKYSRNQASLCINSDQCNDNSNRSPRFGKYWTEATPSTVSLWVYVKNRNLFQKTKLKSVISVHV